VTDSEPCIDLVTPGCTRFEPIEVDQNVEAAHSKPPADRLDKRRDWRLAVPMADENPRHPTTSTHLITSAWRDGADVHHADSNGHPMEVLAETCDSTNSERSLEAAT